MSERYSKLFTLPENLYATGSPVVIAAGALLKDNQTGKVLAQLKLRNIGKKTIKAATVCVEPLDTVGKPLGAPVTYQYLDLHADRDADFGQKAPIALPDSATRSFAVSVVQVIFADNSIWNDDSPAWKPLTRPHPLDALGDSELTKQFRIEYGGGCENLLLEQKDLWYCVCGGVNRQEEGNCHKCGKALVELQAIDLASLRKAKEERVAKERAEAEVARKEAEIARKKTAKIGVIAAAILAVVAIVAVLVTQVIIPSSKYNKAISYMDDGNYDKAITAFEALGDYKDSHAATKYSIANLLLNSATEMDSRRSNLLAEYNISTDELMEDAIEVTPDFSSMLNELKSMEISGQKIAKKEVDLLWMAGGFFSFVNDEEIFEQVYNMYANDIEPLPQVKLVLSEDLLLSKGCFYGAKALFEELGDYRDSKYQAESIPNAWQALLESQYQSGVELFSNGDYDSAQLKFQSIGNYQDSADMALLARNYAAYTMAQQELAQGHTKRASEIYQMLGDFEDSMSQTMLLYKELLKSADIGDYIVFGTYEQDNNTYDGTEGIEWLVLDKMDNRILVISRYALDCMPYNKERGNVTWENSSLRKWLNNDFIDIAFSEDEQAMIPIVTVSADKSPDCDTDPGNATQDNVFLLSVGELKKYFSSGSNWCCEPTEYTLANGGQLLDDNCWYWLRSPGKTQDCADVVYNSANIYNNFDAYLTYVAVRPALWIDLNI